MPQKAAEIARQSLETGIRSNGDAAAHVNDVDTEVAQQNQLRGQQESLQEQKPPVIDLVKGRYCDASGSCVFPLFVSQSLQSQLSLRPHAYAWNINTRREPSPPPVPAIRRFLAYQEVVLYSQGFFETVAPSYRFVDEGSFYQQTLDYWTNESPIDHSFEAMTSGILILGSLFSATAAMAESQLVEHAKNILDNSISRAPGRLSLDLACAWILRTLYLRLTTRPSLAWFASCTSVHVAESLGLHVDPERFQSQPASAVGYRLQRTRHNVLICAVFLNTLISAEYGRSRVVLELSRCSATSHDNSTLMALATVLWKQPSADEDVKAALGSLMQLSTEVPHVNLLIVDVALSLYRKRIHQNGEQLSPAGSKTLLSLLDSGIKRTKEVATLQFPWWNVLSTPFQTLLVLVHVNTTESLTLTKSAMAALDMVSTAFTSSSLVREALLVARLIVGTLREKKLHQVDLLPAFDAAPRDPVLECWETTPNIDLTVSELLSPDGWSNMELIPDTGLFTQHDNL
ncbi:hypothetical protein PRZ48_006611 [Zasmidium cellare]|uniref:Xylanolytic transcriptional activator regulatory domain-containing protein n=1 Tax=Zasmidium cellare TaxID=395010 RepID=A0ABR0EQT9_ZASCE|nr:hypothetical protein PRZ48_006611 [Zasmidium cellare]